MFRSKNPSKPVVRWGIHTTMFCILSFNICSLDCGKGPEVPSLEPTIVIALFSELLSLTVLLDGPRSHSSAAPGSSLPTV